MHSNAEFQSTNYKGTNGKSLLNVCKLSMVCGMKSFRPVKEVAKILNCTYKGSKHP